MRPFVVALALAACSDPEPQGPGPDKGGDDTGPVVETGPDTEDTEPPPPLPDASLVVNEIMPGNESTLNGPDGLSMPDWIELVNTGDEGFELDRLQLRNDSGGIWEGGPRDGSLAAGESMLIWFDAQPADADGVWTGFPLDRENDELVVIVDDQVVQQIDIEDVGDDVSMARTPDLDGEFALTVLPTPGAPNPDAPSATLDAADETWFRTDVVHRIDFTMSAQAYTQLSDWDRPEVHTEVAIDGVRFADVGLKLKGSASYNSMTGKPAFIVDLNQWVPGTEFRGLSAFKLHNGNVYDPTRCHDWLSYTLAREAGMMAPRVGWAEVYVKGPTGQELYYGIYMILERHDASFIEYHHPTQRDTGVILEPNEATSGWGDFGQGSVLTWNVEEGPVPADPATVEALENVDRLANSPTEAAAAEMWNWLDRDLFLTYLAWENVASHWDGYMSPNNWRVYVDGDTHLVSLLPSGAEWTWDRGAPSSYYNGRLGSWCLSVPSCRHDYAAKLVEVSDLVDSLALADAFTAQSQFLDPIIDADPRYSATSSVDSSRATTLGYLVNNPRDARDWAYRQYPDLIP